MNRTKWLILTTHRAFSSIANQIQTSRFNEERGSGFELRSRGVDVLQARFIERVVETDTFVDPFGQTNVTSTTRYLSVSFDFQKVESNRAIMEISNPPRSLRAMMNELDRILDGLTIESFSIDLIKAFSEIRKDQRCRRARITRLCASNLVIGDGSTATIEVSSAHDALSDFKKSFPKGEATIDRIRLEEIFGKHGRYAEISRSGTVKCDEDVEDSFLPFFRSYVHRNS